MTPQDALWHGGVGPPAGAQSRALRGEGGAGAARQGGKEGGRRGDAGAWRLNHIGAEDAESTEHISRLAIPPTCSPASPPTLISFTSATVILRRGPQPAN